jgi:hypothetical protein
MDRSRVVEYLPCHLITAMSDSSFIAYVGDPDFHDGSILAVEGQDDVLRVRVRGYSGTVYVVTFKGVVAVRRNRAEGMLLYALCELRSEPPLRRFAFANWDDDSDARLGVDAADFAIRTE